MKAICVKPDRELEVRDIPRPEAAAAGHIIIKMDACAINPGDITFLRRLAPMTLLPRKYDEWGVSGVGTVVNVGAGVPPHYAGKKVSVYRSLVSTTDIVGTWCEYAQLHFLNCVVLPDDVDALDYSGSLVNVITPYAFWKQAVDEGHKGILATAGGSATGIAMLGIAIACDIPIVSIVRDQAGKDKLKALSAQNILVQDDPNFLAGLAEMTERLKTTAIFDGVGGELVNQIAPLLPRSSTVYSYGFLGKESNFNLPSELFMAKNLTIKSFGNFLSPTVVDHKLLEAALNHLSEMISMPHFKTKQGKQFKFEEIDAALKYVGKDGEKRVLIPA